MRAILCICVLLLAKIFGCNSENVQVIRASEKTEQLNHGFIQVMMMRERTHSKLQSLRSFALNLPSLDIYKSSGEHIYHGTSSQQNAALLDRLTNATVFEVANDPRSLDFAEIPVVVTSLNIGQIKKHDSLIILSISYPGELFCKEQNGAIERLRRKKLNATLIDLAVHK